MQRYHRLKLSNVGLLRTIFGGLLLGLPTIPSIAVAQPSQVLNPCPRIYYEEPYNSTRLSPEGCPSNKATMQLRATPGTIAPITVNQQPSDTVAGERALSLPGANQTPNRIVPADAPTTPAQIPQTGTAETPLPGATAADPYYSPRRRDRTNPPVTPPLPENRSQAVAKVMPTNGNVNVKVKNKTNAIVTYEAVGYTQRRVLPGGEETVLRNLPVPVTVTFVRQDDGFVKVMPMAGDKDGMLEVSLNEDAKPLDSNQGVLRIQKDGQVFLN